MPAKTGCLGTVKYGASNLELLGVKLWSWGEVASIGKYSDNTTNCRKRKLTGSVDGSGNITVNKQDTSGPPLRAGDEVFLELHEDDTGQNYWDGTAVISELANVTCDIENGENAQSYEYNFEWDDGPVGHGACLPPS